MKPDVIVSWPRNCDFPLWRQFIRDNRARFGRVLVVFTEHDGADYRPFIRENFPEAECFDSPVRGERDWRDVAVNAALDRSDAEWVWFTEQDFLIHSPERFWSYVEERIAWDDIWQTHVIGWRETAERLHPSCLFVRRSAIERGRRYFGPDPVDHFWSFGRQLSNILDFEAKLERGRDFEHLQGLSQNHWLLETEGLGAPGIFHRERFLRYLEDCLAVTVPLEPSWRRLALGAVTIHAGES